MLFRKRVECIAIRKNKIALVNQNGIITIPGGGVKKGESLLEAIKRECKEEADIELSNEILLWKHPYYHSYMKYGFPDNNYPHHFNGRGIRYRGEKTYIFSATYNLQSKKTIEIDIQDFISIIYKNIKTVKGTGYYQYISKSIRKLFG